jgi:hypothetical protein
MAPAATGNVIEIESVRSKLAVLWLGSAGLILLTLIIQSLRLVYGDHTQEVWGWILPTLMPTLSLIVTVLSYSALDPAMSGTVVRRDFYRLAFWLSGAYLFVILLTLLVQPFSSGDPIQLMQMSNLWLGPFQGLVASALGVLFASKKPPTP